MAHKSIQITVTGLVQGVGFRPFVYRLAMQYQLTGWVRNTNENVLILAAGPTSALDQFTNDLKTKRPPAAFIEQIEIREAAPPSGAGRFEILESHNLSEAITEISPDIAVCEECLKDMQEDAPRKNYPMVNCTHCGPRFTIIQDLPYDRTKTTMSSFAMCPDCQQEYEQVLDRRFHAQPTACSICGPKYRLMAGQTQKPKSIESIIQYTASCLDRGGIVMIKGLGGMHLVCDAFNDEAVKRLRELKHREGKPFAVMFRDLKTLSPYVNLAPAEVESLQSWRRPIVLADQLYPRSLPPLSGQIGVGLSLLGVMLPYMPFHHQLFHTLKTSAIVFTSGNFHSEPILTDNQIALDQFAHRVDALVLHNREIYNRTDDSVVRIIAGQERLFRRSRGYVPTPIRIALNGDGIIAFGAELTNSFCVGKKNKALLSQYIGDLQTLETTQFYQQTLDRFISLFRITPAWLAVDMHPDYISTKTASQYPELTLTRVQHHHAHIASCMAEHQLDETVIGIALDGTGYGTDGHSWGGEFMTCDLADFERRTHFDYIPMPGGDLVAKEPWRMAVAYLYRTFGRAFIHMDLPFLQHHDPEKIEMILQMIDQQINAPFTSGAGRLFDAVASLLDLVQTATFQAEGPMRLESIIRKEIVDHYPVSLNTTICFEVTIRSIVDDLIQHIEPSIIAAKFHNTIILTIFEFAKQVRLTNGIDKVVLSGGVFQNKYLLEGTIAILQENGFTIYSHATVPTNDGGIALGQLAVAAKRRKLKCV